MYLAETFLKPHSHISNFPSRSCDTLSYQLPALFSFTLFRCYSPRLYGQTQFIDKKKKKINKETIITLCLHSCGWRKGWVCCLAVVLYSFTAPTQQRLPLLQHFTQHNPLCCFSLFSSSFPFLVLFCFHYWWRTWKKFYDPLSLTSLMYACDVYMYVCICCCWVNNITFWWSTYLAQCSECDTITTYKLNLSSNPQLGLQ